MTFTLHVCKYMYSKCVYIYVYAHAVLCCKYCLTVVKALAFWITVGKEVW